MVVVGVRILFGIWRAPITSKKGTPTMQGMVPGAYYFKGRQILI
jgi:hypothetical protein